MENSKPENESELFVAWSNPFFSVAALSACELEAAESALDPDELERPHAGSPTASATAQSATTATLATCVAALVLFMNPLPVVGPDEPNIVQGLLGFLSCQLTRRGRRQQNRSRGEKAISEASKNSPALYGTCPFWLPKGVGTFGSQKGQVP